MKTTASTKGFQQDPNEIIQLACPNEHFPFIYKDGISVKKMFDNHLLRLPETQRVIIPEKYKDRAGVCDANGMIVFTTTSQEEMNQYRKDMGKKLYKLTPAQMGIMGKKCFECCEGKK